MVQTGKKIILILSGGAPFELPGAEHCQAILHTYLGGQAAAAALLDLLSGKCCPCGKLSESWPFKLEDTPSYRYFPGREKTAEYRESIYVGYRYYQKAGKAVRWPFGFGLSYTHFVYSGLKLRPEGLSFTIRNAGERAGAEIWQLYVSKKESRLFRPEQELKGFGKVYLEAGEAKELSFAFDAYTFRSFDSRKARFIREGGLYLLRIGSSSEKIELEASIELPPLPAEAGTASSGPRLPSYETGEITDVPDAEFRALLGREIPPAQGDKQAPLERNDTFSELYRAKSFWGRLLFRILSRLKKRMERRGEANIYILFIWNMTFRGLEKLAAEELNRRVTEGLLELFNGHFFRGLGEIIKGRRERKKQRKKAEALLQEEERGL